MSLDNFLSFLQQLLTMAEPHDMTSVAMAKAALNSVAALANSSHKCDSITLRAMYVAVQNFDRLMNHKDDFAGVPGDYRGNQVKRKRLANMIVPSC